MPLRIALCGSHGTGKTTLTTFIEGIIQDTIAGEVGGDQGDLITVQVVGLWAPVQWR